MGDPFNIYEPAHTVTTGGTAPSCPYCRAAHHGVCSLVKAFEYHPDGTLKRVEFHEPQPVIGVALP